MPMKGSETFFVVFHWDRITAFIVGSSVVIIGWAIARSIKRNRIS